MSGETIVVETATQHAGDDYDKVLTTAHQLAIKRCTHLQSLVPYLALCAAFQMFCMCLGYLEFVISLACIRLPHHPRYLGCVS